MEVTSSSDIFIAVIAVLLLAALAGNWTWLFALSPAEVKFEKQLPFLFGLMIGQHSPDFLAMTNTFPN